MVKDEGGTGRIYFWDEVFGEVLWEFPLEAPASQDVLRFFFNGRLIAESDARPGAGFHYMHRDHLGSSNLEDVLAHKRGCSRTRTTETSTPRGMA